MDAPLWVTLALTLKVAGWATAINLVLGVAVGWLLARRRFVGREFVDALLTLPLVLPPTVMGYYLLVVVGTRGWLGHWLQRSFGINLIFTWQGAVIAASVVSLPLVYKGARAAFEEVDGRFANAARTLGAGELEVFLRVSLPLAVRGIAAGVMLAFARAMGEFGATLMIAGNLPGKTQTLSIAVYEAVQAGNDSQALWLTLVISLVCIAVLVASSRLLQARH
jgi:molybdate transport system permease protein